MGLGADDWGEVGRLWTAGRGVHPALAVWTHRELFGSNSYAAWVGVAVFLTSFGVVINNTSRGGEPKIGTAMLSVGFLLLAWASGVFFYANWPLQHPLIVGVLLFLMIALMGVIVLAGVRIWTPIGAAPVIKPQPVFLVAPPAPSSTSSPSSSS
jgi:hypothetical protein